MQDVDRFHKARRATKTLLDTKYYDYLTNIKLSLKSNPKKFWSIVKAKTKSSLYPLFLNFGRHFASSLIDKANMFNTSFQSTFNQDFNFNLTRIPTLGIRTSILRLNHKRRFSCMIFIYLWTK